MSDPVEELLAGYSPAVQEITRGARALLLDAMPGAVERVRRGWRAIHYGESDKMASAIFALSPLKGSVNLAFTRGAALADPDGLLRGTGKGMRHVKLTTPADVTRPELRALIRSAPAAERR